MARARLHLICGNCGCNNEWEWRHIHKETAEGEVMQDEDVYLSCNNCGTLHSLNNNAQHKNAVA